MTEQKLLSYLWRQVGNTAINSVMEYSSLLVGAYGVIGKEKIEWPMVIFAGAGYVIAKTHQFTVERSTEVMTRDRSGIEESVSSEEPRAPSN